jgi:hypothetical protein
MTQLLNCFLNFQLLLLILSLIFASPDNSYHSSQLEKAYPADSKDLHLLFLIGTADGNLHAVNSRFERIWTTSTGRPFSYSEFVEKDNIGDHRAIPTLNGNIFLHREEENVAGKGRMKKTSVKAKALAENTPFLSKDGILFTSRKQSRVLGLDLHDGSLTVDTEDDSNQRSSQSSYYHHYQPKKIARLPIWLGRVDYLLKATNSETGQDEFKISYSELFPFFEKNLFSQLPFDGEYVFDKDDTSSSTYLLSNPDGNVRFYGLKGSSLHDTSLFLNSPAVNAFLVSFVDRQPTLHVQIPIHYSLHDLSSLHRIKPPFSSSSPSPASLPSSFPLLNKKGYVSENDNYKEDRKILKASQRKTVDESFILVQSVKVGSTMLENTLYGIELLSDESHEQRTDTDININNHKERKQLDYSKYLTLPSPVVLVSDETNDIDQREGKNQDVPDQSNFPLLEQGKKPILSRSPSSLSPPLLATHRFKRSFLSSSLSSLSSLIPESSVIVGNASEMDVGPIRDDKTFRSDLAVLKQISHDLVRFSNKMKQIKGFHRYSVADRSDEEEDEDNWLFQSVARNHRDFDRSSVPSSRFTVRTRERMSSSVRSFSEWLIFAFLLLIIGVLLLERTNYGKMLLDSLLILFDVRSKKTETRETQSLKEANGVLRPIEENAAAAQEASSNHHDIPSGCLRVGSLIISDRILGYGSCGTVCFQGTLHGREVAVKRMLSQFNRSADRCSFISLFFSLPHSACLLPLHVCFTEKCHC